MPPAAEPPTGRYRQLSKPPVLKLPRKPSPASQVKDVLQQLLALLLGQWPRLRRPNLGVRSGSSVLEGALLQQLRQLAAQLLSLAVGDTAAADALAAAVCGMPPPTLQQLQTLLALLGQDELFDFLQLLSETAATSAAAAGAAAAAAAAAARDHLLSGSSSGGGSFCKLSASGSTGRPGVVW